MVKNRSRWKRLFRALHQITRVSAIAFVRKSSFKSFYNRLSSSFLSRLKWDLNVFVDLKYSWMKGSTEITFQFSIRDDGEVGRLKTVKYFGDLQSCNRKFDCSCVAPNIIQYALTKEI